MAFDRLIEQFPEDVYSVATPLVSDKVALFHLKSYIVGKPMRHEDYNFLLPSTVPPVARIGKHERQFKKDCLIAIGSDVECLCSIDKQTHGYLNLVIKKDFFEQIASEATGKATVDFKDAVYPRSPQLLRLVADLQNELTYYGADCAVMVGSITSQIVVQILRDAGVYTRTYGTRLTGIRPRDSRDTLATTRLTARQVQASGRIPASSDLGIAIGTGNPRHVSMLCDANSSLPERNRLTSREMEIASYLLDRLDYGTMAARLLISPNTVKTHVKRIYDKLDISSRKQLETRLRELAH